MILIFRIFCGNISNLVKLKYDDPNRPSVDINASFSHNPNNIWSSLMALIGTDLIRYLGQNYFPKSKDTIELRPIGQFGESLSILFVIDHLMEKSESHFVLFFLFDCI